MATTAATAENKIKDLLLGQDVAGQVELLLNLLSDAAAGKELSNVLSEVIQVSSTGRQDRSPQGGSPSHISTGPSHSESTCF